MRELGCTVELEDDVAAAQQATSIPTRRGRTATTSGGPLDVGGKPARR
jgi:hypothetical protein